jgi:ABC-2 type transport system ATP-binding protein
VTASAPAIELAALSKRYDGVLALRGVDLRVERGELFGLLGPNGAGKTTALRILVDLIRPSGGHARVLGLDAQRDSRAVRARCAYLPGDLRLYEHLTARELLRFLAALRGGRVDAAYRDELVARLDLDPTRPIGALSRGNRQKVGLVQALMSRPELVLLDEPTSGLDPLMQEEVEAILRETVRAGATVCFSSHVLSEVEQVCTRVAMLHRGTLLDVFDLAEQRRLAPRTIAVEFAAAPPPGAFAGIPGVTVLAEAGARVEFAVHDGLDALIKRLAAYTVLTLDAHEPSLEELFLARYQAGGDAAAEATRAAAP